MNAKKAELLSLKEAVKFLNEIHQNDPLKSGRDVFSIGHIYNCIHQKRLQRFGPRHHAQVEKNELVKVLGPKKATG